MDTNDPGTEELALRTEEVQTEGTEEGHRLFDSFDLGSQQDGPEFSILTSPFQEGQGSIPPTPAAPDLEDPPPDKTYDGLLSPPEFNSGPITSSATTEEEQLRELLKKRGQHARPIDLSNVSHLNTTAFLSQFQRSRLERVPDRISRRERTLVARLQTFEPLFRQRVLECPDWQGVQRVEDIVSLTTLDATNNDDPSCGYDEKQGVVFKDLRDPIVLFGYIVKMTPVKKTDMDELCRKVGVLPIPLRTIRHGSLYLEDGTAKIRLDLSHHHEEKLSFSKIVTGIPVAIKGICCGGKLQVIDVLFPSLPAPEVPLGSVVDTNVDMVFLSGLCLGHPDEKTLSSHWAKIDLLFDYLQGLCGSEYEQENVMLRQTKVFILGNLFSKSRRWNSERAEELVAANSEMVNRLDQFLENLARTTEVFVLPGENDGTFEASLPQPPIHSQFFPLASQQPSFHCLTNPAKISIPAGSGIQEGQGEMMNLVLFSGQNVTETMTQCDIDCPVEMCLNLLEWSHIHPLSTDDGDRAEELFTLTHLPHLLLTGNVSSHKVRRWNNVKVAGVPSFHLTGEILILKGGQTFVPIIFKTALS